MLAPSLPYLMGRFATVKAFSEAPIGAVLDLKRPGFQIVEANSLASILLLNRGSRFEAVELPYQAQLAPVFAVSVADFNGDGAEDLFLSQNFFDTEVETPRLDAGRGSLLLGNGRGQMHAVPGHHSGVAVYGQQRGAAVGDFDHDGRTDLVVTQNGAATRLFRNTRATPGLRVKLAGPPGNPTGIGATLRIISGSYSGPARELHCGAGYWSQDSSVQVLSAAQRPEQLWVRWPGGQVTTTAIPEGAKEVTVSISGQLVGPGR
jgi:hypothetical protein